MLCLWRKSLLPSIISFQGYFCLTDLFLVDIAYIYLFISGPGLLGIRYFIWFFKPILTLYWIYVSQSENQSKVYTHYFKFKRISFYISVICDHLFWNLNIEISPFLSIVDGSKTHVRHSSIVPMWSKLLQQLSNMIYSKCIENL